MNYTLLAKRTAAAVMAMAASAGVTAVLNRAPAESTSAYFTDSEHHTNSYSFGDVTIDGTETLWNPEKTKHMVPCQIEAKNPRIENTGTNLAVGYIVVDSPIRTKTRLSDKDGHLLPEADVEIFRFLKADKTEGFNTANWVLADSMYIDEKGNTTGPALNAASTVPANTAARRYIFGYRDSIPGGTADQPTKTDTLFDSIQAQNFVEGSFESGKESGIEVYFLAVQAENLTLSSGAVTTAESTKNMSAETLKDIYRIAAARADLSDIQEADTSNKLDLHAKKRG